MKVTSIDTVIRLGWKFKASKNDIDGGVLVVAYHHNFQRCYVKNFPNENEGKLWVEMLLASTQILLDGDEDGAQTIPA